MTRSIVCIGECMLELRTVGERLMALDYAGDTYNTAFYLAASGADLDVEYATVLGRDSYSDDMIDTFRADGVKTDLVLRDATRVPGLYLIHVDAFGERSFTYYRDQSAARGLFSERYVAEFEAGILAQVVIFFSGITLSILTERARARLLGTLGTARAAGKTVVFDSNYRPQGWASPDVARAAIENAYRYVSIALPSFDDERALFGGVASVECANRILGYGVEEVVVKHGVHPGLWKRADGSAGVFTPTPADPVIDTTGAGDAFNAGYLADRLTGATPGEACASAAVLSRLVTQRRGAITRERADRGRDAARDGRSAVATV